MSRPDNRGTAMVPRAGLNGFETGWVAGFLRAHLEEWELYLDTVCEIEPSEAEGIIENLEEFA